MQHINSTDNRNGGLDALKAICAFLIVCHHLQQDTYTTFSHFNFYDGRVNLGYLVELFFVMSGFLFIRSEQKKTGHNYGCRFIRRLERIWPMCATSVVLYAALYVLYKLVVGEYYLNIKHTIVTFLQSLFLTFSGGLFPEVHGMNFPLWYVCVLIVCYAWYYAYRYLNDMIQIPNYLFFLVMIGLGVAAYTTKNSSPLFYWESSGRAYPSFFLGCLLGIIPDHCIKSKLSLIAASLVFAASITVIFISRTNNCEWYITCLAFSPSLLILFYGSPISRKIFNGSLVSLLGMASFYVYVLHTPLELIYSLLCYCLSLTPAFSSHLSLILTALLIYALCVFIYLMVNERLTTLVKRFETRFSANRM